jgi:hypothetical protein
MGVQYTQTSSQYHTIPANTNHNLTGDWAISFWIDAPASTPYNEVPIATKRASGQPGWNLWYGQEGGEASYLGMEFYTGGGPFYVFNSPNYNLLGTGLHHIMIAKTGTNQMIAWIDGISYQTLNSVTFPGSSSNVLYIGYNNIYSRYCPAKISDFRIYTSRTLTADNLALLLYQSRGKDNITTGLQSRWPMFGLDGSNADTIVDVGTVGTDGTDTNNPVFTAQPLNV